MNEYDIKRSDAAMVEAWSYGSQMSGSMSGGPLYDLPLARYALTHAPTGAVHLFEVVEHEDGRRHVYQWRTKGLRRAVPWAELPSVVAGLTAGRDDAMKAAAVFGADLPEML